MVNNNKLLLKIGFKIINGLCLRVFGWRTPPSRRISSFDVKRISRNREQKCLDFGVD
jgi:hypothetical protein